MLIAAKSKANGRVYPLNLCFRFWLDFFSLAGTENKPRNRGSIPPSSTIRQGEKKALCNNKLPSGIGWKVAFNRWRIGLISECPKRRRRCCEYVGY